MEGQGGGEAQGVIQVNKVVDEKRITGEGGEGGEEGGGEGGGEALGVADPPAPPPPPPPQEIYAGFPC
jgi:hypothetical protein